MLKIGNDLILMCLSQFIVAFYWLREIEKNTGLKLKNLTKIKNKITNLTKVYWFQIYYKEFVFHTVITRKQWNSKPTF